MKATTPRRATRLTAAVLAGGLALAACGGSSGGSTGGSATTVAGSASNPASTQVLPVTENPIVNDATATTLTIDSVLVENNVDASGAAVDDHLEIALSNSGSTDLASVEIYYTFDDPTAGTTENYYLALPASFTVPAGGSRVVHVDNTGAADHFASNDFSLYATSVNALDVTVEVSAKGAALQTATVKKDPGGAENPGE